MQASARASPILGERRRVRLMLASSSGVASLLSKSTAMASISLPDRALLDMASLLTKCCLQPDRANRPTRIDALVGRHSLISCSIPLLARQCENDNGAGKPFPPPRLAVPSMYLRLAT